MIHNIVSMNILKPKDDRVVNGERQAYILQTLDEMRLFEITNSHEFKDRLICTQPLYKPLVAIKRIKTHYSINGVNYT